MKARQKFSFQRVFLAYFLTQAYCYLSSLSSPSTLLAAGILSASSSSWYNYLRVFAYQFPNLITEGMIAIQTKKLMKQIPPSISLSLTKGNFLLNIIYRCLAQSQVALLIDQSQIPSYFQRKRYKKKKRRLIPREMKIHIFLLQLVRKNMSTPCFNVYAVMIAMMQKAMRLSSMKNMFRIILSTMNIIRERAVRRILDSQLPQGQSLTFQQSILMTEIQFYFFSFFFFGLGSVSSQGGRNMTAPRGKNSKLGYFL